MASAQLRSLSFAYGGARTAALRDVDLEIGPGLCLVSGASGSGKSTLLRTLNGLVPHFHGGRIAGSATVAGHDVLRTPTRVLARRCGFVFQDPEAQLLGGSVEREVAFGLQNLGVPTAELGGRVDVALMRTGLGALRSRAVSTLSGGERQRLAIAAAIAMGGELLALDEPTSQLDTTGAAAVVGLCAELARGGVGVVLAEHRLELALAAADRLVLVDGGAVRGPEPVRRLAAELAAPPQVVRLGMAAGWTPLPLRPVEAAARMRIVPLADGHRAGGATVWSLDGVGCAPPHARPCLKEVDLAGRSGEVVVLMGENGGGKSTLLRSLAGLLPPIAGRVERRPGRVAYLPQNPAAVLHLRTVRAEVELTLRRSGEARRGAAAAALAELGLSDLAERHPRDLSSGERQRAALAALLCGRPALALLDEPTRGMDGAARAALIALVHRLADEGAAIVLATHDAELAAELADRVVEVGGGGVRELGHPRSALTAPSPYATQIGSLLQGGPVTVAEALAQL